MQRRAARITGGFLLFFLLGFSCTGHESLAAFPSVPDAPEETPATLPKQELFSGQSASSEDFGALLAGRGRPTAECFQLRPGGMEKKGEKANRCEPQSLPFARCRSGIDSCRLGYENGPLTWFACEKQRGNTSLEPQPGSILILAANGRRKMATGHVAYVEEVVAQSDTLYRLVFTHTNYDRRCSLESNIEAIYDSSAQTLDILGGAWQPWGKNLPVAGFIIK